jgi:hypothetical protein
MTEDASSSLASTYLSFIVSSNESGGLQKEQNYFSFIVLDLDLEEFKFAATAYLGLLNMAGIL